MQAALKSLATVFLSVLSAALFWFGWLAVFIPAFQSSSPIWKTVGWASAPLVTALGFTCGLWLAQRWIRSAPASFPRLLAWPLASCALGAAAVFWFGPMLIVFGMFLAGTLCVVLREVILLLAPRTQDPSGRTPGALK